jgi:RimJ/RimL family protein N-acetyltransferase
MRIETERLILRDYIEDDWSDVLAYQSDPRSMEYYEWYERTLEDAQKFVKMFLDQQQAQSRIKFQLGVTLKSDHRLIGSCGLRTDKPNATEGDIGFEIAPEHWRKGYASEAARAMVEYGFDELKLHRIWSWCIAENIGSAKVLEKLGLQLEGRLREKDYFKGRWWDTLTYGILEDEWRVLQHT